MDFVISNIMLEKLIAQGVEIGFQKGLESIGGMEKYWSQNKAYNRFGRNNIINWVRDGRYKPMVGGNGRNSTKLYDYSKLLELEAANTIVIRKAYVS